MVMFTKLKPQRTLSSCSNLKQVFPIRRKFSTIGTPLLNPTSSTQHHERISSSSFPLETELPSVDSLNYKPFPSTSSKPSEPKSVSHYLTDTFNRQHDYLRISITERCNLRCLYCMPEEGIELSPSTHLLTTEEIIRIAKLFVSQGVRKIRLTGGEPSVRRDLVDIVSSLHRIPGLDEICITSNGLALHRKLPKLAMNGLTALNLSLDTLVDGKFQMITRRNGLSAVLKSLETALKLGLPKVKLNVVVMSGVNEEEVLSFVQMTEDYPLEVRFIEYMPFGGNKWSGDKMVTYEDMLSNIQVVYPDIARLKHKPGDTAKVYQIPGFKGKIGFITSMTENFCSTCTRLRITSDGNLKVCLFERETCWIGRVGKHA
ncbi:unnamed protein product [Ambrosiozyma monospora]|uniref:Unnamed protein product n=1 Tax=Ambrosiozyma monospora TaxID=43982 RepID=A0ACB5T8V8_AMBMO|nr:unnamed protein product [Ambrosiozyma monospora]